MPEINSMNDDNCHDEKQQAHLTEIIPASATTKVISQPTLIRGIPHEDTPPETNVDFSRYVHSLRRNWLLGITIGLIIAGPLAYVTYQFLPDEYTARELVRISSSQSTLVNVLSMGNRDTVPMGEFKGYKNTQKQLVMQPYALGKALKQSEVATLPMIANDPDPIKKIQKLLKIEFPDDAELMSISLAAAEPTAAYNIVKTIVDIYMKDVVDKEKTERLERVNALEILLRETEERVRKKRNELERMVDSLGMGDKSTVDLSQQKTIQQFGEVRSQLGKTKYEIMTLQNELEMHRIVTGSSSDPQVATNNSDENRTANGAAPEGGALASKTVPHTVANDGSQNAGADTQNASTETKDTRLEELLESDVVAVRLIKEVDRLKNLIKTAPKRYDQKRAAEVMAQFQPKLEEAEMKLEERTKKLQQRLPVSTPAAQVMNEVDFIKTKIGIFKSQEKLLRDEMEELLIESKKFGKSSIEVELLRKEIDNLEPMVTAINQKIEQTKIELQSASRVTRLPSSGIPTTGENKKRLPMTAVALLAGLFGPLLLLMLRDLLRNHVNGMAAISNGTNIVVLGSIPLVPAKAMKRLNDPSHKSTKIWRDRIAESVAGVTAMLLRRLELEGHRIIMVASATSGEGKSTLAELLARSLADSGHRTLLIDFDFRKPELHRRFNVPLEPGASDVLRAGIDLKQAARSTYSPNLNILTAGRCPGNLMLEAANGTLFNLFKECRAEFEIVVVDTSPLVPVVDGRLIGRFTDGAIMSVIKDTSQISQVITARTIMGDFGIPILGCVVSGESCREQYYGYGSSSEMIGLVAKGVSASRSMSAM